MSINIVPTQMALFQSRIKLKSAQKGHDLLKRKADALKVQFMQVTKKLIEKKKDLGSKFKESLIMLAKANFNSANGDVNRIVEENVKSKADVTLTLKPQPIAGVILPKFGLRNREEERYGESAILGLLGLTGGGQTLNVTKKNFYEFLKNIVEIASLQTSYLAIDECLKITNRRVNALEFIVIPKIQYTIKYIETEIDERGKEEKYKIKKVLNYKQRHREDEEKQREEENKTKKKEEGNTIKTSARRINNKKKKEEEDDEELDADDKLF